EQIYRRGRGPHRQARADRPPLDAGLFRPAISDRGQGGGGLREGRRRMAAVTKDPVTCARFPRPVSAEAVRRDWKARGFSCENFIDPPGCEWNDFVHDTDELVTLLHDRLPVLLHR